MGVYGMAASGAAKRPFISKQSSVKNSERNQQVPKIAEFQNDQESNGERSGIRSTLKAVSRSRQAFLLSEKLQGIANDTPKTLQISSSIFAQ
jgi:hypothetical protein